MNEDWLMPRASYHIIFMRALCRHGAHNATFHAMLLLIAALHEEAYALLLILSCILSPRQRAMRPPLLRAYAQRRAAPLPPCAPRAASATRRAPRAAQRAMARARAAAAARAVCENATVRSA